MALPVMYQTEVFRPGRGWEPLGNARQKRGRAMADRSRFLKQARADPGTFGYTKVRMVSIEDGVRTVVQREVGV